ncbi:hypothetical protein [Nocardia xishanensis]
MTVRQVAQIARITDQFMTAATTGDTHGLLALLAPGATWIADSGGKVTAARRRLIEIFGGKITDLYAVRNPDKLATVAVPRRISR